MFSLEVVKIESLVKIVNFFAKLKFVNNNLKIIKILDNFPLNSGLCGLISIWLVHDGSEPRSFFTNQAVNELMEVCMIDYSYNLFSYCLHVAQ